METGFQSSSVIIMIKADFFGIYVNVATAFIQKTDATCEYIFVVNKPDMSVPCLCCCIFSFNLDFLATCAHFDVFLSGGLGVM